MFKATFLTLLYIQCFVGLVLPHSKNSELSELAARIHSKRGSLALSQAKEEAKSAPVNTGPSSAAVPNFAVLFNSSRCSAYPNYVSEAQSYRPIIDQIVAASLQGSFKGLTYKNLADFVDTYQNRISGSQSLEDSIDYLAAQMNSLGLTNVRTENVFGVPAWKRGSEVAQILSPVKKDLAIFGLGSTASTPFLFGLTKEVVVFNSYAELIANQAQANNKIVVCNFGGPGTAPLDTAQNGYAEAVSNGAAALLYKSATSFSLYSPHARRANLYYGSDPTVKKVPIAYITIEDSQLISRISARGQKIVLYLNMQNSNGTRTSRNLFGDLPGREIPDELVLLAGHTDSWDVGQGAQDDGFAIYLALQGLNLLKSLNLIPRRTIRAALWTAEEYGYLGSESYIKNHLQEFSKLSAAMEADYGCLSSTGLIFNGKYEFGCLLKEIASSVASRGGSLGVMVQTNSYKSDLDLFQDAGVPVVSLYGDDGRYFYFHHSEADTMTAVNSATLDQCLALWTATAYVLADLNELIPKGFDLPS